MENMEDIKNSGLVIKKMADKFWVNLDSVFLICTARGILKDDGVFVGDKVIINLEAKNIEEVLERKNLLVRPSLANLDQLFICLSDNPQPDFLMLDKLLLFCKVYEIEPIICYTKIDIGQNNFDYLVKVYGNFYKILALSSLKDINIKTISNLLKNKISAFAGQSGVGKSALINALFGGDKAIVGDLSDRIMRGKNTTRHVELFELSKDTFVADTPGFSALDENLLPINYYELPYYYPDFLDLISSCAYKSCTHTNEKECGIKKAVKNGLLDEQRYIRYTTIFNSLKSHKNY